MRTDDRERDVILQRVVFPGESASVRAARMGKQLLRTAVGYWDVDNYVSGAQIVPNFGIGGSALDAQLGSTSSVDSNDPQYLPYSGTPYVYLPGVAENYLSVPDAANLRITSDIEIVVRVAAIDWTTASVQSICTRRYSANAYAFRLYASKVEWVYWQSGVAKQVTSTAPPPQADGSPGWLKLTFDADNGASGSDTKFWWAADVGTNVEPSSWTQLGSTVVGVGVAVTDAGVGAPFQIGGWQGGGEAFSGNINRVIVRNGIGGTTVLDVDTSVLTSGSAASFTAATGQTVTINRSSSGRKAVAVVRPVMLFGTDDYLKVADNDLLDFGAGEPMTAVIVARQWATPTSSGRLMSKWNGTASAGWMILDAATAVTPYGYVRDATHVVDTSAVAAAGSSGTAALAGFVVDRTAQTVASFNGATISSTVSISAVGSLSNSYEMQIGRDGTATYQDFEFLFAAVFRRALSASEISTLATYAASRMP